MVNYLAPQYKCIHLEATNKLESTKDEIQEGFSGLGEPEPDKADEGAPISPTAPMKVENLVIIKVNKTQIAEFKKRGSYELKDSRSKPFGQISVEQVLANLQFEEAEDMFAEDILESDEEDGYNASGESEESQEEEINSDDSDIYFD